MLSHAAAAQPGRAVRLAEVVVDGADAAAALRTAASIGPYFVTDASPDGGGWRSIADLLADGDLLAERVSSVRGELAARCRLPVDAVELRATASVHFLGLTARLLAPAFAGAALTGTALQVSADGVFWRAASDQPMGLAIPDPTGVYAADTEVLADLVFRGTIEPVIAPLADAFGARFGLSPNVLWGNVASGLGGAYRMLAAAEPAFAAGAAELVVRLLDGPALLGSAEFGPPEYVLMRNNCCLFYRIPGAGTCGDCVLNRR
jgi:hypothetical protein